jgi:hypothetical protein
MNKGILSLVVVAVVVLMTASVSVFAAPPNPADFTSTIDHPLFPLSSLGPKVFEGEATDPDTDEWWRRDWNRASAAEGDGRGVEVVVLEEKAFVNGELVEWRWTSLPSIGRQRLFFGDGSTQLRGRRRGEPRWPMAISEGENEPGIIMRRAIVEQTYDQDTPASPDKATVISVDESVTAGGSFDSCLNR